MFSVFITFLCIFFSLFVAFFFQTMMYSKCMHVCEANSFWDPPKFHHSLGLYEQFSTKVANNFTRFPSYIFRQTTISLEQIINFQVCFTETAQ